MANMKKVDKADMISRIEKLEGSVGELSAVVKKLQEPVIVNQLLTKVPEVGGWNSGGVIPMGSLGPVVVVPTAPSFVETVVKHKCQTEPCGSMETKPYDRPTGRLWLCDKHKF